MKTKSTVKTNDQWKKSYSALEWFGAKVIEIIGQNGAPKIRLSLSEKTVTWLKGIQAEKAAWLSKPTLNGCDCI